MNFVSPPFYVKQRIYALENAMLSQDITIPVYFSKFNAELETVVGDLARIPLDNDDGIKQSGQQDSALTEIINSISANGYQVINMLTTMKTAFLKYDSLFTLGICILADVLLTLGSCYRCKPCTKQTI